jgi:small basic protein (TIGR04137 family)
MGSGKAGSARNVLKRFERLRTMMSAGRWQEGQTVFGLPKLKAEKRKAKKAAPKEAAAAEGAAAAPAAPAK